MDNELKGKMERLKAYFMLENEGSRISKNGLLTIYNFYEKYGITDDELFNAMEVACKKVTDDPEGSFKYFCSIIWHIINPERYAQKGTEKITY